MDVYFFGGTSSCDVYDCFLDKKLIIIGLFLYRIDSSCVFLYVWNMEVKSIQLYQLAHKKLHLVEKDAMELVDVIQDTIEDRTKNFVTKEYLDVRLMELELKLLTKIADSEKTILRWMFTFWVGQLVAMFGFIYLFLKH